MPCSYRAFGLEIVADNPVLGLVPSCSAQEPDVRIHFNYIPEVSPCECLFRSPSHPQGGPALNVYGVAGGSFLFQYKDQTAFLVNGSGSEVWVRWPECFTQQDADTYLLGPILGFLLRLRGVVSLHASGIVIGGSAIAVVGQAGAGKSTIAAAFAQLGYAVLTDDVFALVDLGHEFWVEPGHAGLRLWPDSAESLWGSAHALPPLTPNWDKRHLDLQRKEFTFDTARKPVRGIYVLGPRSEEAAAPFIRSEPKPLINLLANTYVNYLLDKRARAREFDLLGRLANCVPIRRVTPHLQASRLPELCNLIVADVGSRSLVA